MIRYKFAEAELVESIRADDRAKNRNEPWLDKARRLTTELRENPKAEIRSQWSEVKSVYTKRQNGKCAFCERLLGEHERDAAEIDVEHFRPKNAVKPWPSDDLIKEQHLPDDFPRSKGGGKGLPAAGFPPSQLRQFMQDLQY